MIDTLTRSRFGVPNVARKLGPAFDFVPVIFANGEDDDLPGIAAALQNEAVQYGEHVYLPDLAPGFGVPIDKAAIIEKVQPGRNMTIMGCTIVLALA